MRTAHRSRRMPQPITKARAPKGQHGRKRLRKQATMRVAPEDRLAKDTANGDDMADSDRLGELLASIAEIKARMERERLTPPAPSSALDDGTSIIALDKFIQATRDSGYKGTASAVSELVDNSIQAGATTIDISVRTVLHADEQEDIEISVLDNGCGMDAATLRQALRFGGSTRFGARGGLGRYGMGLPNASLSQARRVSVYSWERSTDSKSRPPHSTRKRGASPKILLTYLDVDQIMRRELVEVPDPVVPDIAPPECSSPSGTLVVWSRCDRLDNRRISTICRKLEVELGRRFRYYSWSGLRLTVNGNVVRSIDPLYLHQEAVVSGGQLFGEPLCYEMRADPTNERVTGRITVRFSELPVTEWHGLPNEEKRRIGLSKGAGVSIVRAGREVDYGWFFMGTKHRENYDDWWRCEVHFDPVLDEAFGITHTKQQIRPRLDLLDTLSGDIEGVARALNSRSRKAHLAVKASDRFSQAVQLAGERDHLLPALPRKAQDSAAALMKELEGARLLPPNSKKDNEPRYQIVERAIKDRSFFSYAYDGRRLVLVLNPGHPFYRDVYGPLVDSENPRDRHIRTQLELLLLCAARTEATLNGQQKAIAQFRLEWSNALATFLNG